MSIEPTCYVRVAKLPWSTRAFNASQKVWLRYTSGNEAVYVCGRWRGKGRYVSTWINWRAKHKEPPTWKDIEVSRDFANRHYLSIRE